MYEGYRLQINGAKIPNTLIAKGTYSLNKEDRVADEYEDSFLIKHTLTFGTTKTVISFDICEHDSSTHPEIVELFSKKNNVEVTYYDDDTDSYVTGKFRIRKITYSHLGVYGSKIDYASTPVTLEEY